MSSTSANAIPALAKKSVKARFCNTKNDLLKLREHLRKRCKQRMNQQREELLNQKRFGVTTDDAVLNKLKEIFHAEMKNLVVTERYKIPTERVDEILTQLSTNVAVEPQSAEEKLIIEEYKSFKDLLDESDEEEK
ncbi:uncharacterized protein LOC100113823 [Nasonia vitripennis]|uniref:Uncharacterized protein n=1 Tax=Nasonia vitripennis TaxID=7425 RepID=A0A7M7IMK9_NASVI|nr:uncharacterized protein LOC100113823 [Nasonia vitripennis]XP_016838188.1 uncharacterized protein LOC100113823 [Nasonia vitripennis]